MVFNHSSTLIGASLPVENQVYSVYSMIRENKDYSKGPIEIKERKLLFSDTYL